MAAPVLYSTASSFTLPSSHRLLFRRCRERSKLRFSARILSAPQRFYVCCSSSGRQRAGKKVLTNVELCNEIKELLYAVGLPEDHVPSIKELSLHGRNDLANIVRRRGYKFIKELLTNAMQMDVSEFDTQKSLPDEQNTEAAAIDRIEKLEGQGEKADSLTEQINLSDEAPWEELFPVGNNLHHHVTFGGDLNHELPVAIFSDEKSTQSDGDAVTNNKILLLGETATEENSSDVNVDMEPNLDNIQHVPSEFSYNMELASDFSSSFMDEVEEPDYNGEDVSSTSDPSNEEKYPQYSQFDSSHDSGISVELSDSKTLEEKVVIFMKDGCLDLVDDNLYEIYEEIGEEELNSLGSPEFSNSGGQLVHLKDRAEMPPVHIYGSEDPVSSSTSVPWSDPVKLEYLSGDNRSSGEGPLDACMDKFVNSEMTEGQDQAEVSRLRYMLHQKELELSHLKEEIEKEKLALSFLQMKAESEINKAQKLISEKDAELQAAEESLSGLKEVEIQYCGDGDIVEVAGSFNGWHHRIKMDPGPLAISTNSGGSRKSRLWSTMLWLYPGVYEIKFIVDGQWVVDSERESTMKGSICNNILRVGK
ncbi:hypothetical protein SAY87_024059 [Trapa incisa]|uniref:AMP-activated protein kinase glycogen-binding domain-containing protein n=1 Tax=Trapa incisa TaxID=236973 RepID=A0AAN7KTL7_9MYRT|nr:hypothetical protein SAY87_024059 [Trapa incisa]